MTKTGIGCLKVESVTFHRFANRTSSQRKSLPSFATAGFFFGAQQTSAADTPRNAY
jgi:hypothetical protein